ncbi:SDR family oxidoreductase [uncultured Mycolicibacterium sp.]|mgnify:CR=1 FL=1|uniref:SDR family NAD(P)-dependent oxidoreductase n=1 Tax=uncultured Mycolicibacterium sp. TaxID=2320817 RepID=UPI002616881C|nr:SDR family NAD(P)-dependent oxidoreductase [uncultured Mycolicibacterium sp.]
MSSFTDKVAVVTGAASGIGAALAVELAERGTRLAVSDVDEVGLQATADAARRRGVAVHTARLDVADRDAVTAYADAVREHYGVVHQLYNNAGIALDSGSVLAAEHAGYERILGVNLWGVIHGTKAFLPHLIASGDGHLVNISSINGIFAQSCSSGYCTTKFAVRGFTESVRVDMLAAGHPVRVTVVHPGGVRTNIANAALSNAAAVGATPTARDRRRVEIYNTKLLRMPPQRAARIILDGVAAGRPRVLVGADAKLLDLLVRLMPGTAPRFAAWLDRRTFGPVTDDLPAEVRR